MSAASSGNVDVAAPASGSRAASLLYWLLVVCGLAGLTVLRIDTPGEIVPLWLGTVVGVALGQLVGYLRVRGWVLLVVAMSSLWVSPVLFMLLANSLGPAAETSILAFLPAAVGGYLSLSGRGGLIAFWYPAVLWMLVILDGPAPGAFDTRAALPLLIGLGALFVAFLRARETRRVAIWRTHASARLAKPLPREVLRTSPLRAASQIAWTGLAGAAALVLAAWIAPHLWQKEHSRHERIAAAAAARQEEIEAYASGGPHEAPCCPDPGTEEAKRARVREFLPLLHGHDETEQMPFRACNVCRDGRTMASTTSSDNGEGSGGSVANGGGAWAEGSSGAMPSTAEAGWNNTGTSTTPKPTITQTSPGTAPVVETAPPPTYVATPTYEAAPHPASVPFVPSPPVTAVPPSPGPAPVRAVASPRRVAVVLVPQAAAPPTSTGAPWKSTLAICLGGLALHVLVRALRRQLTLRHLARPFWNETLDQRISNHWQRMLIGLRDAGIQPKTDEQPNALAKRVGIEGMETCSTILERVRHGVRVDEGDLETMNAASGAVYRAAREKAGVSGRAAAWLRWPLA